VFPAIDFDGNSYHLTFIGNVIQNHNFFDTPTSLLWLNGYPKGGEFIAMWNVLIPHSDSLVDLAQIPFLVLGIYALYVISVSLGAEKRHARFASIIFLFMPIVLNQLKTTYVDVMLSSLFFAGVALTLRRKPLGRLDLVLVGIIFSLLIATKSTGILFIVALLPILLWNLHSNREKDSNFLKSLLAPLITVFLPTLFGLYWYAKNYFVYGSPIYPFGFKVGGIGIFPGKTYQEFAADAVSQTTVLPNGCIERIWFVWTEQKDWFGCLYNYDSNYTGFGPIWFIVLLPAILMATYFMLKMRSKRYFALLLLVGFLFTVYPANYYSRYTMFIALIGIVSLAIVLTNTKKIAAFITKPLVIVLSISVIVTNFTLCNYGPKLLKEQLKDPGSSVSRGAIYKDSLTWAPFKYLEGKVHKGDVLVYDSVPYFIYPLWRPDFANKVIYVPAKNSGEWERQLQNVQADYILTTVSSKENKWADDDSDFDSVYKDELYEIFKYN
jgi:hypothetical protein